MVYTPGIGTKEQIVSPLLVVQGFRLQRANYVGFAAIAKLFLVAMFQTVGTMD
tara:strand:+ start:795 stop:953 length:159 start_codon:yes stop_codon:yes gene_type:complete